MVVFSIPRRLITVEDEIYIYKFKQMTVALCPSLYQSSQPRLGNEHVVSFWVELIGENNSGAGPGPNNGVLMISGNN